VKLKVAVFKFASCDGCQLQFLNLENEILTVADAVDFAFFPEARSRMLPGPYDLAFVEGSISTPEDARRIQEVRAQSRSLVTIGACATAGGIQALRNWAEIEEFKRAVYPRPEWIQASSTSTPISEHVRVDFEVWGCPVDKRQLLEVLQRVAGGNRPVLPTHSVCMECKRRGNVCVVVTRGEPCLGPVTRTGCGALCPALGRGCYGCFGPADDLRLQAFGDLLRAQGLSPEEITRRLRGINGYSPPLRKALEARPHDED